MCVRPAVRAVYQRWKAEERVVLPGQQRWTIRGMWDSFSFLKVSAQSDFKGTTSKKAVRR